MYQPKYHLVKIVYFFFFTRDSNVYLDDSVKLLKIRILFVYNIRFTYFNNIDVIIIIFRVIVIGFRCIRQMSFEFLQGTRATFESHTSEVLTNTRITLENLSQPLEIQHCCKSLPFIPLSNAFYMTKVCDRQSLGTIVLNI